MRDRPHLTSFPFQLQCRDVFLDKGYPPRPMPCQTRQAPRRRIWSTGRMIRGGSAPSAGA
ncbi:hypothetical protein BJV78DRAFT_1184362 [Lactifluus subvellereus]|nr:hypothetical protein BJV78DRAFT_1184362 [Lactifluus subvellereus]